MSFRAPRRNGFTVVELLIVMGIIALLLALLLPSLARARDRANRTTCLNNLRQIGLGLFVYVTDHGEYPVLNLASNRPTEPSSPVYYAADKSGLLALPHKGGFERYNLACPDGWASQGDASFYESRGIARNGAAFMDYAYWPWRFPPGEAFEVKSASFRYRQEKGNKIVVTDIVTDDGASPKAMKDAGVGAGNHGSNHYGDTVVVPRTDGRGNRLSSANRISASGATVLFADNHAEWFDAQRLTQQVDGLCYPPVDRW